MNDVRVSISTRTLFSGPNSHVYSTEPSHIDVVTKTTVRPGTFKLSLENCGSQKPAFTLRNTTTKNMGSARRAVLHLLQCLFKSCSSTYCLPYRFNNERGFYVTESNSELFLWKLNTLACLIVAIPLWKRDWS